MERKTREYRLLWSRWTLREMGTQSGIQEEDGELGWDISEKPDCAMEEMKQRLPYRKKMEDLQKKWTDHTFPFLAQTLASKMLIA